MPPQTQAESEAIQLLATAARAAVADALWPFSLANVYGHLAISREVIEKLEIALKVYDDTTLLKGQAAVRVTITDGEIVILEAQLQISPDQAQSLADSLLNCAGTEAPILGSPPIRSQKKDLSRPRQIIRFGRVRDRYGCFSNFAPYPIQLKGKIWPTVEHYVQAQKFAGAEYEDAIRLAISPAIAAHMGRDRAKPLRPDWDEVKYELMREAVLAKFTQHPKLAKILLSTGDAILVERTRRDSYLGDGHGKNMLGRILMGVRDKLKRPNLENLDETPGH